jgi:hypothetical protein
MQSFLNVSQNNSLKLELKLSVSNFCAWKIVLFCPLTIVHNHLARRLAVWMHKYLPGFRPLHFVGVWQVANV